jgi:hypothetical protein
VKTGLVEHDVMAGRRLRISGSVTADARLTRHTEQNHLQLTILVLQVGHRSWACVPPPVAGGIVILER